MSYSSKLASNLVYQNAFLPYHGANLRKLGDSRLILLPPGYSKDDLMSICYFSGRDVNCHNIENAVIDCDDGTPLNIDPCPPHTAPFCIEDRDAPLGQEARCSLNRSLKIYIEI